MTIREVSQHTGFTMSWLKKFYTGLNIKPSGKTIDSGYSKRKRKSIAPTRNMKCVDIQKEIIRYAIDEDTLKE